MLSKESESFITDLYQKDEKIQSICLLKADGNFSLFLTKKPFDEGEKKRLAASIMASFVLAERSIVNIVQEHVKHVVIKSVNSLTVVFLTNQDNYLYIVADKDFQLNELLSWDMNF